MEDRVFQKKVEASEYPTKYLAHIVGGVGEELPFKDESFDLITTYQTLEHVRDVKMCIKEMLRVLKPGGILYIKAPDYKCFFEPHYRIPFLPKMNKKLASIYLKLIGRPILGLQSLQYVTEKEVVKFLIASKNIKNIERNALYCFLLQKKKIKEVLPKFLRNTYIINFINYSYQLKTKIRKLSKIGREENHIDLWVTKIH